MRVTEYTSTGSELCISLEPENPAEIALFKLLAGCEAKFETGIESPKDGALIIAMIKKVRGY